jgi:hypothetical protein
MTRRLYACAIAPNIASVVLHMAKPCVDYPEALTRFVDALTESVSTYPNAQIWVIEVSDAYLWIYTADEAIASLTDQYRGVMALQKAWNGDPQR